MDTGVVIAAERQRIQLHSVIGDDDPAISAITAMELLTGIDTVHSAHRDMIALNAEAWLAVLPVANYTIAVARAHAFLMAHTRQIGRPRGAIDLMIAATAAATGRTLITTDAAAEFDKLPGVKAEVVRLS